MPKYEVSVTEVPGGGGLIGCVLLVIALLFVGGLLATLPHLAQDVIYCCIALGTTAFTLSKSPGVGLCVLLFWVALTVWALRSGAQLT